ncbi:MAG: GerMN domain-containing protein [bacterium]
MKKIIIVVLSIGLVVIVGLVVFMLTSSLRRPYEITELPPISDTSTQPEQEDSRPISLYFLSSDHKFLVREPRTMVLTGQLEERLAIVVKALLAGPDLRNLRPTIPAGTQLRALFWDDKQQCVTVSLSQDFLSRRPGHALAEWAAIYSLVNTISDQDSAIRWVQILVEGELVEDGTLWDLSEPFAPDHTFVFYDSAQPIIEGAR